ncbi:DUF6572 domain-containing protein [Mesorhizobium sp. M0959]|uniref:DUF6572 domain-containing protein n=1 Tax=unclassified Mesorhizobium TaxID=325217 RepID=UPI0033398D65
MAVQHTDVVDIVAKGKNGEYLLSIVDDLDWDDVENHLVLLENKLNLYCVFVLEGQFYKEHPDAVGRPVMISVALLSIMPAEVQWFFTAAAVSVEKAGLQFEVQHLSKGNL